MEQLYDRVVKVAKIYISPARHPEGQNLDVRGKSERSRMLTVGRKLFDALATRGFNCMILNDNLSLRKAVNQSNIWGADLHVSLHSNASNGLQSGVETWIHRNNAGMEKLSQGIILALAEVLSIPARRGSKGWAKRSLIDAPWTAPQRPNGLYEVEKTNASAILIELYFHDNEEDCLKWKQEEDVAVDRIAGEISHYLRGKGA